MNANATPARYLDSIVGYYNAARQTPTKVESWYDRSYRLWVVRLLDQNGFQIGSSSYVGTREWRDAEIAEMQKMVDAAKSSS